MTRGAPLFVLVCALASAPLYSRPLGMVAVAALVVIFLTPAHRRHASADRRSREAASPDRERE